MPYGRFLVPTIGQLPPYGGWKNLEIGRLGDITLIHGPELSGRTQALTWIYVQAPPHASALYFDPENEPYEHVWSHLPSEIMSLDDTFAAKIGINLDDLADVSETDTRILRFCATQASFPGWLLLYDNIDSLRAGERWPIIWDHAFEQAETHGTQIVTASNDPDVISGLALAHERHPACSTTLVVTKENGEIKDHTILAELHDFDASTALKVVG